MERQTDRTRGIIIGLLVGLVLVTAPSAQAGSGQHHDPNDSSGRLDIREATVFSASNFMGVRVYERWLGSQSGPTGPGNRIEVKLDTRDDRRVDLRLRMRADTQGRARCDLFRGSRHVRRLYAIVEARGHLIICDLYPLFIDEQVRWRVVAFDNHEVTDRAPNHGWYRGP